MTNTLATGGDASVTIRSLDPALLQFQGSTSQTIQLGGRRRPSRCGSTRRRAASARARVQMTVTLGSETDAFETTLPVIAPAPLETQRRVRRHRRTRDARRLALPAGILPGLGGLHVRLASTALVGLGEGARYLVDYPFGCAEQKASARAGAVARRRSRQRVLDGPASRRPTISARGDVAARRLPQLPVQRRRLRLLARRVRSRQRLPHQLRAARDEGRATASASTADAGRRSDARSTSSSAD